MFLTAPGLADTPAWHLSVDGMSPTGPNLSHWPGNRTPAAYKADLSTGICLRFAAAPKSEREDFLQGAEAVLNDHYDTDGFGSLLSILRPGFAAGHREQLLRAAGTGDFGVFIDEAAFAVDRSILHLAAPHSPVAGEFAGLAGADKMLARYRWLIDNAALLLEDWPRFGALFQAELGQVLEDLERPDIQVRSLPELELCLIRSRGAVHRMALNTLAGSCYRVLHSAESEDGWRFRYHDRTESWFELATFAPLGRKDLRPLAGRLQELWTSREGPARWCADAPDQPIPELYHGIDAPQEYGSVTRELSPLQLDPGELEAAVQDFHVGGPEATPAKS